MDLLFLLLFVLLVKDEVFALKLSSVDVPPYIFRNETAHLYCRYSMESDKLYSVLWYKDNEQFYKYVESDNSQNTVPGVKGFKVDQRNSNKEKVVLQHISLEGTGMYKCEVTTVGPPFLTVHGEAFMEVIQLPTEGPMITGEEKIYATGDVLSLNCTSGKSYPPAQITWFINNIEVKPDSETEIRHHDLVSTISSLRLELGPHHITSDQIDVRCEAIIETSYRAKKPLKHLRDTHVFVQGHANLATSSLSLVTTVIIIHWMRLIV